VRHVSDVPDYEALPNLEITYVCLLEPSLERTFHLRELLGSFLSHMHLVNTVKKVHATTNAAQYLYRKISISATSEGEALAYSLLVE